MLIPAIIHRLHTVMGAGFVEYGGFLQSGDNGIAIS